MSAPEDPAVEPRLKAARPESLLHLVEQEGWERKLAHASIAVLLHPSRQRCCAEKPPLQQHPTASSSKGLAQGSGTGLEGQLCWGAAASVPDCAVPLLPTKSAAKAATAAAPTPKVQPWT
jgi:hypothetical protein